MNASTRRVLIWSIVMVLLLAAMGWSFWPQALQVESAPVTRGPLRVEVSDEGRTRVRESYQVSAPVAGRLLRVEKHAGDPVTGGKTIVAYLLPTAPGFLDIRSRAQGEAALKSAIAARDLAQSLLARAKAELAFATSDLARSKNLAKSNAISQQNLEKAELAYNNARSQLTTAEAYLQAKEFDLQSARAQLIDPENAAGRQRASLPLKAPASGRVLRVLRENEAVVAAGTPIMEIGDPKDLEVVVELISEDAVKVHEGDPAAIGDWGGPGLLAARVRRIEPSGFTKVSALGVEEQRVNVLLDFVGPSQKWENIADSYRVAAHIVIWQSPAVLRVPASAMFRSGNGWAVFKIEDGRAKLTPIETGHTNDSFAEVRHGLMEGDRVVPHPSDRIRDGVKIRS
jgi:HlyD family secretion protein